MPIRTTGMMLRVAGLVVALSTGRSLEGCAAHAAPETQPADASTITSAEIDSAHVSTAYDVIMKLRPQILAGRGRLSLDPRLPPTLPRVYVDDQFYGDPTTLRGILTGTIESIRYYSGSDAQYKYGQNNAAGVIAIITKH